MTKQGTGSIYRRLYDFIDVLRDARVAISTDEVLQLFNALHHVPVSQRPVFKQTLQTSLIKDYTDIPIFDQCFERFFKNLPTEEDDLLLRNRALQNLGDEDMENLEQNIDDFLSTIDEADFIRDNPADILPMLLDELEQGEGGGGGLGMLFSMARGSLTQGQGMGDNPAPGEEEGAAAEFLIQLIRERMERRRIGQDIQEREDFLFNRNIYQLTPEEIREMRELIRRFGQKLKSRISLRKKRVKHGGIDIKRTLRKALQYDGIPFKISYKDRKIDRPQLVILCDVSGSVSQYTRFMLLLTHTLQSLFGKVRAFAFISCLVEITDLFMEMDPERAINSIFSDTDFTYGWGSNYGQSFDQFIDNHSDALNRKTTVLILGDARNNNQDPGLESLLKIKEKSRHIFWLNPDRKHLWGWSDSLATFYEHYCTEMREVNSFRNLSDFIDQLLSEE